MYPNLIQLANKLHSLKIAFDPRHKSHLRRREKPMTFEQWTEQVKKGLSPKLDEKQKIITGSYDRSDRDMDEEESTYNLSQNS
jgi:hypothetical protein